MCVCTCVCETERLACTSLTVCWPDFFQWIHRWTPPTSILVHTRWLLACRGHRPNPLPTNATAKLRTPTSVLGCTELAESRYIILVCVGRPRKGDRRPCQGLLGPRWGKGTVSLSGMCWLISRVFVLFFFGLKWLRNQLGRNVGENGCGVSSDWGLLFSSKYIPLIIFPLSRAPPGLVIIMRMMMPRHLPSSYNSPNGAPFTDEASGSTWFSQPVSHQAALESRSSDSWC